MPLVKLYATGQMGCIETFFSVYRKRITSFKQKCDKLIYFNMVLNFKC